MPCYKPMLATPYCISHETGKVQYKFREKLESSGQLNEVVQLEDGNLYPVKALPCGKCIGCRLDYSKEWAIRCTLELQDHDPEECFFVTLTYNDETVPVSFYPKIPYSDLDWNIQNEYICSHAHDDDRPIKKWYELNQIDFNGICVDLCRSLTLRPKDLQDFIKRVRSWQDYEYGNKVRFYACGEYGSRSARPHYHLIMYGLRLKPAPADCWRTNRNGNTLWECKELERFWKFGNVVVGRVTYESCGYVARYMLKKRKGEYGAFYKTFNIVPEFTRMSLKPGIGLAYYDENKLDIYENDQIFISTEKRGIKVKPPRYFDIRAADELPGLFDALKIERSELAYWNMVAKEERSGLNISEVLFNEEEARKFKTKILQKRSVGNEA